MKILHVAAGNLFGGVETCLIELARARDLNAELRHEFAVCFTGRLEAELRDRGAAVHVLGGMRASRPWTVWRTRSTLSNLLVQQRFDVAIMHSCWCHALLAGVVKQAGVPTILWGHSDFGGTSWEERLTRLLPPIGVVANSEFTARSFLTMLPGVPCRVVRYLMAAPRLPGATAAREALRMELGIAPGTVVILQASRMEEWKGHRLHLEALARLCARTPWLALFAGGAQRPFEVAYENELKLRARGSTLGERVRFLGQRRDVPALMNASDIFCQPNTGPEPFGLVFIEALYAGRPAVTCAFGGAAEIVNENCGALIEPGDVAGLADVLTRWIDDSALRLALGAAAPERARELCEPQNVLHALVAALEEFGIRGTTR
jgi:glycosyltransferase involved in cell wall biosynthesis